MVPPCPGSCQTRQRIFLGGHERHPPCRRAFSVYLGIHEVTQRKEDALGDRGNSATRKSAIKRGPRVDPSILGKDVNIGKVLVRKGGLEPPQGQPHKIRRHVVLVGRCWGQVSHGDYAQ